MSRNTPLPYHALSNLLTLFSHDVPTLPLIQHTFDYLFVRPPVACVYVAAAVCLFSPTYLTSNFRGQMILARKEEVTWLEAVGEEGMLHSILSSLPNLYEEGEEADPPPPEAEATPETKVEDTTAAVDGKPEANGLPNGGRVPESTVKIERPSVIEPTEDTPSLTSPPSGVKEEVASQSLPTKTPSVERKSSDVDVARSLFTPLPNLSTNGSDGAALNERPLMDGFPAFSKNDTTLIGEPITKTGSEETKPAPTPTSTPPSEPEPEDSDPWPDTPGQPTKARISLSSLLRQADELLTRFPPSHPKLDLDKIMGPRSTVFTWTVSFSSLPPDDELEQYVKTPHLVVLPYIDPVEDALRKEKEARELERSRVERRRKLRKSLFARANVQKKTAFAGAVLALGIALAVYGIRAPGDAGRGHHRGELKKLLKYIGGLLLVGGDGFVGRLLGH